MAVPWVRAHVRRTCTARLDRDLVRGEPRGPSVRATMTQALRWLGLVSFLGVTLACSSSNSSGSGVGNDGGGGSGGTSGDAGDSVSQICAAVAELPCSSLKDPEACKDLLQQQQQHAETAGCGAENQALYDCRAAHPDVCNNGQQSTNPECSAAESAVYECAKAAPQCTGGGLFGDGGSTCGWSCDDIAESCTSAGGDWSCTCTSGPKAGATFTVTGDACNTATLNANCG